VSERIREQERGISTKERVERERERAHARVPDGFRDTQRERKPQGTIMSTIYKTLWNSCPA